MILKLAVWDLKNNILKIIDNQVYDYLRKIDIEPFNFVIKSTKGLIYINFIDFFNSDKHSKTNYDDDLLEFAFKCFVEKIIISQRIK